MIKLRDYQERTFTLVEEAILEGHRRIVVVKPTGAGKTVWFSKFAREAFIKGKKTLIDVNRIELLSQAKGKLEAMGVIPTMVSAKTGNRDGHVYVAMVETLARRMAKGFMPWVDFLILDEAHIKVHDKIIEKYMELNPDLIVLGVTATPIRGINKPMPPIYTKLIEACSTREMVDWGYLVRDKTFGPVEDFSDVKMKGDDFDAEDLHRKMKESNIFGGIVDNYKKNAAGLKAICYSPNVAASLDMCQAFLDAGISARHLDGEMDEVKRKKLFLDFSNGVFQVLCNVNVATTGYDEPSVQCIIVNRATKSLSLWLQMVGRGSRPNIDLAPFPDQDSRKAAIAGSNKPHFVVLDHGSNWTRHSLWSSDREWSLVAPKKKDAGGVAGVKECPECGALIKASARACEWCEYELPVVEKVARSASEFVEIEAPKMPKHLEFKKFSEMTIQELEDRRVFGNGIKEYTVGWVVEQLKIRAREQAFEASAEGKFVTPNSLFTPLVQEYADIKGYKPGWVYRMTNVNLEAKREKPVIVPGVTANLFEGLL